ncbi:hypothetical protein OIDMADRAFT_182985 [Oidiodendron maius Zn]|uniref:NmrA-like domain-containing protein n=1 Tax=Oidiodendron maius (strain Zn) TaxID=913774 RepID=A0A0C3CD44_OIDMZ|nr:hypothetical protein OIDMADRAFT_182985 [Oidiodendron maius Zn]
MSSDKKVITVFGATGNQGGSVITALLSNSEIASTHTIRGVTRDPSKPSAQKLKSKGVEPIKADLDDLSSLVSALAGSYSVFAVTNYWGTMSKSTEIIQGKNIVDACISTGVKHLVWSSLPGATALTNGLLKNIEHFDSKAEVSAYAESKKAKAGMWVTHLMPGFYMQSLKSAIQKDPKTGISTMFSPWIEATTNIPLLDIVSDTGKFVAGALVLGSASDGKFVQGVSQWSTPGEVVRAISAVTGEKTVFQEMPVDAWEEFLQLPPHARTELGENMVLIRDFSYYGKGSQSKQSESDAFVHAVKGQKLTTLAEFVGANWTE